MGRVNEFWKVGVAGTSVDPWKEGKMKIYPVIAWYKAAKKNFGKNYSKL